ncbi:MAG: hypothetical protein NVSMB29_05370 [Candidatus Dormibacteria bacterium]
MTAPSEIGGLLLGLTRDLRRRIQERVDAAGYADFNLTHQAVFAVLPDDGARIGQLARSAQLAKQTMTGLVGDLVSGGYLERVPDPEDGRATLVRRTRRGNTVHAVAQRALAEVEREWRQTLGDRGFDTLVRSLKRVR